MAVGAYIFSPFLFNYKTGKNIWAIVVKVPKTGRTFPGGRENFEFIGQNINPWSPVYLPFKHLISI